MEEVAVVTTEYVPGYEVERVLGIVWGASIKARHLGKDVKMALKHLVGGELTDYTEMMEDARRTALSRMVEQARRLGADAVVGVRFTTSMVVTGAAEIIAYGTAVKLRRPG
ncbi:MAG: YbjQ family protein [Candidatus Nezhaarchaeales archaeon]